MKRKDTINKTGAAASKTAAAASKAGTEVRRAEAAAPDAAGRNAGKWKRVRGIAALVLTLFLLFLAFQAHLADQPHESWYFPLAAALAVLAGLYLYIPLPLGKTGGKIYTVLTAICAPFLSFVIVEFYNKGFWHVGAALSTATAEPPYLMIILNTLIYALFFLVRLQPVGRDPGGSCRREFLRREIPRKPSDALGSFVRTYSRKCGGQL